MMKKAMFPFVLMQSFLCSYFATAIVICNNTLECEQKLRKGSICNSDGHCTNPFAMGCLRRMKEDNDEYNSRIFRNKESDMTFRRVCNSHDNVSNNSSDGQQQQQRHCDAPDDLFSYPEIRISPGNWESSMFFGWIVQIILSEVLGVPASIDTGENGKILNFYDTGNAFDYPTSASNFDALAEANRVDGICSNTHESCAHFMPEVWSIPDNTSGLETNKNGMVASNGWFLPKHTAKKDSSLTNYLGLQGNQNRKKLAETFLRPMSWKDYCTQVSPTQCITDDGVAKRSPRQNEAIGAEEKKEENLYYSKDNYIGHFRSTEKNDCTINPNCTGHIIDYPCTWTSYTVQQIYWNDIALETDVEYTYKQMLQVVEAANATGSNIMLTWWYPEPTIENFIRVSLPKVSRNCLEHRFLNVEKCTMTDVDLRGNADSGCDYLTGLKNKFYAQTLQQAFYDQPLATRSPAYSFLKDIQVTAFDIDEMLNKWNNRGVDKYGYDGREAVCTWVANNIDKSANWMQFIPPNYPRKILKTKNIGVWSFLALLLSFVVTFGVLVTFTVVYYNKEDAMILYAQPQFLYIILIGYLTISVSAILYALPVSDFSCSTRMWFELAGYTLANVPLLAKTAAINSLMQNAVKMKRAVIKKKQLFRVVGLTFFICIMYLLCWRLVDPMKKTESIILAASENGQEANLIIKCSSKHFFWSYIAHAWEMFYIFCASILAVQSRNVIQQFNESDSVRNMAYVSFLFLTFRLIVYYSMSYKDVISEYSDSIISTLLSFDVIANLAVYFGPKFWKMSKKASTAAAENQSGSTRMNNEGRIRYSIDRFQATPETFVCSECKKRKNEGELLPE